MTFRRHFALVLALSVSSLLRSNMSGSGGRPDSSQIS
jgi:hypothetical protein